NHARPGGECRHNLTYWRYGDYAGIGPGAHGRLSFGGAKHATRQHRAPEAWLDLVERQGHGWRQDDVIAPEQRLAEMVMMGLRLSEGISRAAFEAELGAAPEALLSAERLQRLAAEGYLMLDDASLSATPEGRQRLDAVLGYLLA
ncbi:MAG: coproporphyrinogen III oxidase, partial [Kiloniellaceae bacterium]